MEPIFGGEAIHRGQSGYAETAGSASLTGAGSGYNLETLTSGLRFEVTPFAAWPITARGLFGYRQAFGDISPTVLQSFEAAPSAFSVTAAPLDRRAVVTEFGLSYKTRSPWTLGVDYTGQYGNRAQSNAFSARAEYRF